MEAKWIDALRLPLRVTLAVAAAGVVVLGLHWSGLIDLATISPKALPIVAVVTVLATALAAFALGDLALAPRRAVSRQRSLEVRRAVRKAEQQREEVRRREQVTSRLLHLSVEELRVVIKCLDRQSPSFYAYANSPPISILMGKGLVWTPGGPHNQDHYPFSFHDFVWVEMQNAEDDLREQYAVMDAISGRSREA